MKINVLILAGGSGNRLWPKSRTKLPKQFLSFFNNESMFQSTIGRFKNLNLKSVITICNSDHRFFAAEQLNGLNLNTQIILEPDSRNTAPAITAAINKIDDDEIVVVLPADHLIEDKDLFIKALYHGIELAKDGNIVTFGIVPSEPNTGYGYIEKGNKIGSGFHIKSFKEKPCLKDAQKFINSNKFLWNSGIFVFKKNIFIEEMKQFQPDIVSNCDMAISMAKFETDFIWLDENSFKNCDSISIDYALMEMTSNSAVIPMDVAWNDVGSLSAIWENSKKDANENVSEGDIFSYNTNRSYLSSENQLLTVIGCEDIIVVATKDSILVCNKKDSQNVRKITEHLKKTNRYELDLHRKVYRPWGSYDSIENGNGYQVKNIYVKPGAKLSVQSHKHRSEHWVVVSGEAEVTKDDKKITLRKNESTYIEIGTVHSLENKTNKDLHIIEVQCGDYLGEDDIVRYDDIYGREGTNT